ncbi:MAG: hypothetical protein Q7U04_02795 [Bacteriovorax sp.]|nr:hypothetical protein [Bacteriovorax sp.]
MKFFLHTFSSKIILISFISFTSCANAPQQIAEEKHRVSTIEEARGSTVTAAVAMKAESSDFVEIQFNKGSSLLTEDSKSALKSLINDKNFEGKIDKLLVLSWSDEEYPSKNLKTIPKVQRELAEDRNKSIKQYLTKLKNISISTFNMAERPNIISKLFQSTDSKLKNALLNAGLPTSEDPNKYAGKASHSVILLKTKSAQLPVKGGELNHLLRLPL